MIGGYALTLGAGLVLGGRLGDRYGRRPMFLGGLVAFTLASLLCAVTPNINEGQSSGWPLWTWLSLSSAALGYVAFALWQRRAVRRGRTPLVTPTLFGKSAFTIGLVAVALFFGGLIGTQLVLTFFLQIGQGFTAGQAGLGNLFPAAPVQTTPTSPRTRPRHRRCPR